MNRIENPNQMKAKLVNNSICRRILNITRIIILDQPPVIIGGCGRTGTSLISAILDAHPDIISYPTETNIFRSDRNFKNPRLNYYRNMVRFYRFLIKLDIQKGTRRWCEKTPRNVTVLGHIFKEFRNEVKVILMIRDGRDVIISEHPKSKGYYIPLERWIEDTSLTLSHITNRNVLIVPYESLILHFENTIKRILDFIGSTYDDKVVEYTKFSSVQSHEAFHGQKLKGISSGSVNKWKQDKHKERVELLTENAEAMDLLKRVEQYRQEFEHHV